MYPKQFSKYTIGRIRNTVVSNNNMKIVTKLGRVQSDSFACGENFTYSASYKFIRNRVA